MAPFLSVAVVIASKGRPQVLAETVRSVFCQSTRPSSVILSVTGPEDVASEAMPPEVLVLHGMPGLTAQRNNAIRTVSGAVDLLIFLDDDVELDTRYIEKVIEFASGNKNCVLFSGALAGDGAVTGALTRASAHELLEGGEIVKDPIVRFFPHAARNAYGCNMAVRSDVAAELKFDERLKLYGWLEDRDFASRCRARGTVEVAPECRLVHLGVTSGRVDGTKLGYAQVVNPVYLWKKGTLSALGMLQFLCRALAVNSLLHRLRASRADRTGRLRGNMLAFRDIVRSGAAPEKISEIV